MTTLPAPPTQERRLLDLKPAVQPLPAHLNPRRVPLRRRFTTRFVHAATTDRAALLLLAAVTGGALGVLGYLPEWAAVDGAGQ